LLATVREYFDSGTSIRGTAARMSVHVNTVNQRLERVDRLLGHGWRAPVHAFPLRAALRLDRLRSSICTLRPPQPWTGGDPAGSGLGGVRAARMCWPPRG